MLHSFLGRCTVYYIAGLLLALYFELEILALSTSMFFCLAGMFYFRNKHGYTYECFTALTVLTLGANVAESKIPFQRPLDFTPRSLRTRLILKSPEGQNSFYRRYRASKETPSGDLRNHSVLLELPLASQPLDPGDILEVKGRLSPLPRPLNPGQFNYGEFLKRRGYTAVLRVRDSMSWTKQDLNKSVFLRFRKGIVHYHRQVEHKLEGRGWTTEQQSLFMALLFGQKKSLNASIKDAFKRSGLMHILAVSGLHLGLLVVFLKRFIQSVPFFRRRRMIALGVLLSLLTTYAALTGFSPSVVRALLLFAMLSLSRLLHRNSNTLDALALAALLTLVVDPAALLELGFQMSYAAVFFILWFNQLLRRKKLPVPQYFADLFRVSFSAQLGVLPLSLGTFHQFSAGFMLSNLLVLPCIGPLLGLLWVQLILLETPWDGPWINFGALLLHHFTVGIAELSKHSLFLEHIPFEPFEIYLLYACFLALGLYLQKRSSFWLYASLSLLLFQQAGRSIYLHRELKKERLYIPHIWGQSALVHQQGKIIDLYTEPGDTETDPWLSFQWVYLGLQEKHGLQLGALLPFSGSSLQIKNAYTLVRLGDPPPEARGRQLILWIHDSPRFHFEEILDYYKPDYVVADGSNASYLLPFWEQSCQKYHIAFHATHKKGAFELKAPFDR